MRKFKLYLFLIVFGLLFYSCDPCNMLDCASSNYWGQFRLVSAADGKDLVFGPTRVYDKNAIRFYSLKGVDTSFLEYRAILFPNTGYDSILYVEFLPKTELAYMRLSNGDIDTLNLTFNSTHSRCCGDITEISNFRYNDGQIFPGNEGTQALKK